MPVTDEKIKWVKTIHIEDVPENGGNCVKIGDEQVAIFNFTNRKEWYATSNLCPHKMQMILSRGLIGDKAGEPKVSCPYHKKSFSLKDGACLTDEEYSIKTYPIKIEEDSIYIGLI
jgi:nitrite reductase (NADH) small subunit